MENKIQVKKILRKIYNINYSNITLNDDDEFILLSKGISEFSQMLRKIDTDNGIIVTFSGYRSGLFYSLDNDGELYSSSKLLPDIVNFGVNLFGLKKGYFYRITILARDTDANTVITDDRSITVIDDSRQVILDSDVKGFDKNQECVGYFRALTNEANLNFNLGKVIIKDIIIDEVVLAEEENFNNTEEETTEIPNDKTLALKMYGIYGLTASVPQSFEGRFIALSRYSGKGIDMFFDRYDKTYYIEKSNIENIINEPFTNFNFLVDLNINKMPNNDIFDTYKILEVSTDISKNTLKQGYIKFALIKNGKNVEYTDNNGRLYVNVYQYQ